MLLLVVVDAEDHAQDDEDGKEKEEGRASAYQASCHYFLY
jgi:hypothetical protein